MAAFELFPEKSVEVEDGSLERGDFGSFEGDCDGLLDSLGGILGFASDVFDAGVFSMVHDGWDWLEL